MFCSDFTNGWKYGKMDVENCIIMWKNNRKTYNERLVRRGKKQVLYLICILDGFYQNDRLYFDVVHVK